MLNRDIVDIVTGMVLAAFGFIIAAYATTHYNLGSLQRMGPGMVPMGIGSLIALLGVMLAIGGTLRTRVEMPTIEWRPLLTILGGLLAFSLAVPRLGLAPAIILLTLISAQADKQLSTKTVVALMVFLVLAAILIFRMALGMNIPIFRWAF